MGRAEPAKLPTREVARAALRNGGVVHVNDDAAAVEVCNRLAPEHLQVLTREPGRFRTPLRHCAGLFLGPASAEVLGDYGIGPNHVLPTGGAARVHGGLSVLQFLRLRSWLELDSADPGTCADAVRLAELEGLAGHAAAARRRGG
ncbi:MAG: histidinol dehydrogenase [Planctomycetes bacterium]|nr:histidinol dehydrogenase [Planctomycetota bacterium]